MAMTGKERQLKYRKKAEKKLIELVNQLERKVKEYSASLEEKKLTSKYLNLSHQEMQVANYIMHGKSTKEIAELMGLADRTIDFHRTRIRKKMGLVNKKETLRTHLLSFQ